MEGEQDDPACRVNSISVRMMALFCDPGRNVMDRDDPVEDHDHDKNKKSESKVVQEGIANHFRPPFMSSISRSNVAAHCDRSIDRRSAFGPKFPYVAFDFA